jgi:hypothetical protein
MLVFFCHFGLGAGYMGICSILKMYVCYMSIKSCKIIFKKKNV